MAKSMTLVSITDGSSSGARNDSGMSTGFRSRIFRSAVFPKFRQMVLQAAYTGNKIQFSKIPDDEKVNLISVGVKDGKVVACVQEFRSSKEVQNNLVFEETTPEEFARKLKRINTVVE